MHGSGFKFIYQFYSRAKEKCASLKYYSYIWIMGIYRLTTYFSGYSKKRRVYAHTNLELIDSV